MAHDPYAPKRNPAAEIVDLNADPLPTYLRRDHVQADPPRLPRSVSPDFDALAEVIDNAVQSINERPVVPDLDPLDDLADDFTRIPILQAIEMARGIVNAMGGDTKPDSVELAVAMAKWGEQRKHPDREKAA